MGCGGSTLCPAHMPNNPHIDIGKSIPVKDACNDFASSPNAQLCPQNGEWTPVRGDSCKYDSLKNGCRFTCSSGCEKGHCAIAGFGTKCRRSAYLGSPKDCCLTNSPTVVDAPIQPVTGISLKGSFSPKTCAPEVRGPSAEGCVSIVKDYCSSGSRIFDDPICKEFCALGDGKHFDYCMEQKSRYCSELSPSEMVNNQFCMPFCKLYKNDWGDRQPKAFCDTNYQKYCEKNALDNIPDNRDPRCSCIINKLQTDLGVRPECFSISCMSKGYQTLEQVRTPCPECVQLAIAEGSSIYQEVKQDMPQGTCTRFRKAEDISCPEITACDGKKTNVKALKTICKDGKIFQCSIDGKWINLNLDCKCRSDYSKYIVILVILLLLIGFIVVKYFNR